MHDHEFEKQVHQKMEELSVSPSEAVWAAVEGQLHKKEDKRGVIWIVLFLAAILSGGYLFFHINGKTTDYRSGTGSYDKEIRLSAKKSAVHLPEADKKTGDEKNMTEKKVVSITHADNPHELVTKRREKKRLVQLPAFAEHIAGINSVKKESEINSVKTHKGYQAAERKQGITAKAHKTNYQLDTNRKSSEHLRMTETEKTAMLTGLIAAAASGDTVTVRKDIESVKEPSAAKVASVVAERKLLNTAFSVSVPAGFANQTIRVSKKRRLDWGVSFQAGRTSIGDGKLNTFFARSAADNYSLLNPSPNNGTVTSGNVVSRTPSAVKAGFGFSTGLFLKKQLNRRVTLSAGSYLTLFTTSISTGSRVDSAVTLSVSADKANEFFRNGTGNTYTNRYYFVELPLLIQFQLNKGKKVPLFWETGFSISQLINSNALHYNVGLNGYYKDNHLLNKTQLAYITGLSARAFSGTQHALQIGPQFRYGLTRLLPAADKSNHLLQYGIKISTVIR